MQNITSIITRIQENNKGYPTKVQLINRKQNEQWYINCPTALARAIDLATKSGHGDKSHCLFQC